VLPLLLYVRRVLAPCALALADEQPPPGKTRGVRARLSLLLLAVGAFGVIPPAVVGAARLDGAASDARQLDDFDRALALAAHLAKVPPAELRSRVAQVPRAVVLDDGGELWPPDARGHVETLINLGPPHVGFAIGFRAPPPGPTRVVLLL